MANTADGNYILTGVTESYSAGGKDCLMLKYGSDGALSWARVRGVTNDDVPNAVKMTLPSTPCASMNSRVIKLGCRIRINGKANT